KGYKFFIKQSNVAEAEEGEEEVREIVAKFGTVDNLGSNAGITSDKLIFKITDDKWEDVMNVHLKGTLKAARKVTKDMIENKDSRIINLSSTSAQGNRGQVNYSTAKAGLQGFTKTLAIELGKFGITTNAVAPGFIETEMTKDTAKRIGVDFDKFVEARANEIPVKRSGNPEDIANAVAFFADEASSFVNGQVIYVAGGPKD